MTNGRSLAKIAMRQDGVFSHSQATDNGFSDRQIIMRLRSAEWTRVLPGIYRHSSTPLTERAQDRAALLWAGPGAVLSHRSAGKLWQLEGVEGSTPEVTVAGSRHPRSKLVVVHRTLTLPGRDVCTYDGFRTTQVARTIIDLASVLDEEQLEIALECARRRKLLRDAQFSRRVDALGGRGRLGVASLRAILSAVEGRPPSEFPLEVKVARKLRSADLPEPARQHWVRIFGRRYRLDFAWPSIRLALEPDGRRFHDFEKDREKWRHLSAAGWRVLPVTWRDVHSRWDTIEAELRTALASAA